MMIRNTILSTAFFISHGETEHYFERDCILSHGDTEDYFEYDFDCYSYVAFYLVICGASSTTLLSNVSFFMSSQFLSLSVTAATFVVTEFTVFWQRL